MSFRIATIVGARPQFIKAAAISRAISTSAGLEEHLIHTGQHFDDNMSAVFFRELAIPEPKQNLGISGGSHGEMTGKMLQAIEKVVLADKPDLMLVYGDTNSTLAGALVGAKAHIPVAHVEAGLRSFNRRMPEEINRVLTDEVSELLFCPTKTAVDNLAREGITEGVFHTGDVMYDATLFARNAAADRLDVLKNLDLVPGAYTVCTIHRSENTDDQDRLTAIIDYVRGAAAGSTIVMPIHPRTRQALSRYEISTDGLTVVDPLSYFDLHRLLASAAMIMTDSGGMQKEAYFHRVPCVTLRDETEWVETVHAGWNRLWTQAEVTSPRSDISDYGKGGAADDIVRHIEEFAAVRRDVTISAA